jgi:hypothetical protein
MDAMMFPALLVSLSAGAIWLFRRRWRRTAVAMSGPSLLSAGALPVPESAGTRNGPPVVCPTCLRRYPAGLRFCPSDARALVAADDWSVDAGGAVACGVCRRSFDPGTRFCPFDSEELSVTPSTAQLADGRRGSAKICPSCTGRYAAEEAFCGRDGTELVVVN